MTESCIHRSEIFLPCLALSLLSVRKHNKITRKERSQAYLSPGTGNRNRFRGYNQLFSHKWPDRGSIWILTRAVVAISVTSDHIVVIRIELLPVVLRIWRKLATTIGLDVFGIGSKICTWGVDGIGVVVAQLENKHWSLKWEHKVWRNKLINGTYISTAGVYAGHTNACPWAPTNIATSSNIVKVGDLRTKIPIISIGVICNWTN